MTAKTYTIDVWQGESIWTWEGIAPTPDIAEAMACAQLNEDWECAYDSWDELASDMNGTAMMMHPAVMGPRLPLATLQAVEAFLLGFEDDADQKGVCDLLRQLRAALPTPTSENATPTGGEQEIVKGDLVSRNAVMNAACAAVADAWETKGVSVAGALIDAITGVPAVPSCREKLVDELLPFTEHMTACPAFFEPKHACNCGLSALIIHARQKAGAK